MVQRPVNRLKSVIPAMTALPLVKPVEPLESRVLLSTSWFVAPNGSDQNAGTLNAPFKTIQHAASIAIAGDHVEIRGGTYHETVTPAHSGAAGAPITFEAYNGEQVYVSGADAVTGWSSYGGSIYQASMPWTLSEGNDQVFVDGQMINEARFPNTSLDVSHPTLAHASRVTISGTTATLYDPTLSQPAGFWTGAIIHIAPGQAWIAQTGKVLSSAPGQITYSFIPLDSYELPTAGNAYYLTGTFKALDGAGEWYRDSSGRLSIRTPASDSPAGHDIEAKHRLYAFDVSGDSYITIQNINIFAATINSNGGSTHLVVNHISARYVGQFMSLPHGWDAPSRTGIVLAGADSILENSTIAYGAGDGVFVAGANSRVTNNVIHDVDYVASDSAGIRVYGAGSSINHNTIYNTGRSGILHSAARLKILYNVIHDAGLQTTEAGGIYTVDTNGQGTEIAYNKISNMHSGGFGQTGLFLDNNSSNFVVDHNDVSNVDHAMKLNFTCRNDNIYNNTLDGSQTSVFSNEKGDWNGTTLTKNVLIHKSLFNVGASAANNATAAAPGIGAGDFVSGATSSTASSGPPVATPPTTGGTVTPPTTTPPPSGTGSTGTGTGAGTTGSGTSAGTGSGASTGAGSGSVIVTPAPTTPDPAPIVPVVAAPAPPPITDPTPGEYATMIAADRLSIKAAKVQRAQTLKDLNATIRADAAALRTANRQLRLANAAARRARKTNSASPVDVSTASAQINALRQKLSDDRLNLSTTRQSDFTNISAARATLKAHQRALKLVRQAAQK